MPEPAAYVRFADNGNIRMWSKSAYEGEEFMKPLYTTEALRDVCKWWLFHPSRRPASVVNPGDFHHLGSHRPKAVILHGGQWRAACHYQRGQPRVRGLGQEAAT